MTQALPSRFRARHAQLLSCLAFNVGVFMSLCPSVESGFSKKLKFYSPFFLSLPWCLRQHQSRRVFCRTPHNISFCSNSSETLGRRSSVEHFHKLWKATLRANPKLVTNLGKVGVCVWTCWTTKLILHRGLIPARMAVHVLWDIHNYLPFWAQIDQHDNCSWLHSELHHPVIRNHKIISQILKNLNKLLF